MVSSQKKNFSLQKIYSILLFTAKMMITHMWENFDLLFIHHFFLFFCWKIKFTQFKVKSPLFSKTLFLATFGYHSHDHIFVCVCVSLIKAEVFFKSTHVLNFFSLELTKKKRGNVWEVFFSVVMNRNGRKNCTIIFFYSLPHSSLELITIRIFCIYQRSTYQESCCSG